MQAARIRKKAINIRKVRKLHRIAGVYFFVLIIIVSVTGLLLAWKKDVPGLLSVPTQQGTSQKPEEWMPFEDLYNIARKVVIEEFPDQNEVVFNRVDLRPGKGVVKFIFEKKYFEVQLDAATGRILSRSIRTSDIIENVHDGSIIDHLLDSEKSCGKLIISTLTGFAALFFAFSGIWLRWQRKVIRKRYSGN